MKLKKDKRSNLLDAANQFYTQILKGSDLLNASIYDLIEKKLDTNKLDQVIQFEHEGDIAKENYINILYKDKRALPFLVEDRYKLIKYIDTISDKSEEIARGLKVFPFEFYDDIREEMKKLNDIYKETIKSLIEMIKLMETDFKTAYEKSFDIETLKRSARDSKFRVLGVIYKKSEERSLRIYLTSKICIKLYDMIEKAEEISDFLRSLIIKYPSK